MNEPLTDRDREMLAFEHTPWRYSGAKEDAIRQRFGVSVTRYYRQLNTLIDNPAALAEDPVTVKRLRRLRDARRQQRGRLLSSG